MAFIHLKESSGNDRLWKFLNENRVIDVDIYIEGATIAIKLVRSPGKIPQFSHLRRTIEAERLQFFLKALMFNNWTGNFARRVAGGQQIIPVPVVGFDFRKETANIGQMKFDLNLLF